MKVLGSGCYIVVLYEVRQEAYKRKTHEDQRNDLYVSQQAFHVEQEVTYQHQNQTSQAYIVCSKEVVAHDEGNQKRLQEQQFLVQSYEVLLVLIVIIVVVRVL